MEVVKIDPKEYGLEEKNVAKIEEAFTPKIIERDGLEKVYEQLITQELSIETCYEAGELRKKLMKVRTGISKIHKTQKSYFLAAGRFVDAWKNKEILPITQMEDKLSEMEKHFELIEEKRIQGVQEARVEELSKYVDDANERELGTMDEDVWKAYISTKKRDYDDRIAAEKKAKEDRIEEERKANLYKERKELLAPFWTFLKGDQPSIDFGELDEKSFKIILTEVKQAKLLYDEKQEEIRKENEQLKKEAEERERLAEVEKEKREKEESKRLEKERKEKKKQEDKLKVEREEKERLENELKAKEEAEQKAKEEKEERERLAELAPDKDKLLSAIKNLNFEMPKLESQNAIDIHLSIEEEFEGFVKWANNEVAKLK